MVFTIRLCGYHRGFVSCDPDTQNKLSSSRRMDALYNQALISKVVFKKMLYLYNV